MIVGKGLIARLFEKYAESSDIVIFASGVSNSDETDPTAYEREKKLLKLHLTTPGRRFIYFSTCSIFDPERQNSAYVCHKRAMEALIRAQAPAHHIFRLPQVVGHQGNPHTLANFLHDKITTSEPFTLWSKAVRALLDADDVAAICSYAIDTKALLGQSLNIFPPNAATALDIVRALETVLGRTANYRLEPRGASYHVDTTGLETIVAAAGVDFHGDYIGKVLRKYYGDRR